MRSTLILLVLCCAQFTISSQSIFTHKCSIINTISNGTLISQSKSGSNTKATVIVTHNWGSKGVYNNHPIGVEWKNNALTIVNLDGAKMPKTAKFNVLVSTDKKLGMLHKVTSSNRSGHITFINNARWNKNPNVKLLITQSGAGAKNPNPIGIYYTNGKWAIYNQNMNPLPNGASFYVYECQDCKVVTASSPNNNFFDFSNERNNPNAQLFVSQYWTSVYNPHEIGLWYNNGKWSVYNEDRKALPRNSKFIVGKGKVKAMQLNAPAINATYAPVKARAESPGKIKIHFYGISVDDHQENTWGNVTYTLQKKSSNGKFVDVKPVGKSTASQKWSASKGNPLMCYPYPKSGKPIRNINQSHTYDVDMYAVNRAEYRIKYEMKLTCSHQDNFAASLGDHAMKSYVTDYITVMATDKPEIFTLPGKKYKTSSNRIHTFRAQFGAVIMK